MPAPDLQPQLTVLADWLRALRLARDLDYAELSAVLRANQRLDLKPERFRRMERPGGAHPPTLRALLILLEHYRISEIEWLALYRELRQISRSTAGATHQSNATSTSQHRPAANRKRMRMRRPPGLAITRRIQSATVIADVLRSPALFAELARLHATAGPGQTRRYLYTVLRATNTARDIESQDW